MHKLLVTELLGAYCGTAEEGDSLYEKVKIILNEGEKVELDFNGVELASSSFFGALLRGLMADYGPEALSSSVHCRRLQPHLQFVLNHTLTALHT